MEGKRETRFELATSNLEGWHSTTELLPQTPLIYHDNTLGVKGWQPLSSKGYGGIQIFTSGESRKGVCFVFEPDHQSV